MSRQGERSRRLAHPALDDGPGVCPLDRVRATDQQRLALVLEGVALLAHLEHGGWILGDGGARSAWSDGAVGDDGRLRVERIRPGRFGDPPQIVALALLRRVFGGDEIAGRGAARRVARKLVELWRQELAPIPADVLVEQIVDSASFLWQPRLAPARRSLAAVHTVDGVRHTWLAGPGRVRRRFLRATRDPAALRDLLASDEARDVWDGVDDAADPRALARDGRWRRAAAAWRRRQRPGGGRRSRSDGLHAAHACFALGRWEECLRLLQRRTDAQSLLLRLRAQLELGERNAASKTLGRIDQDALAPLEQVTLGEVAVRLAAGRGDRSALARWTERLLAIGADAEPADDEDGDGAVARTRARIVAAGAAWDSGDTDAMARHLDAARGGLGAPSEARRWHHMEGLRRLLLGDGPGAAEHVSLALAAERRRLLRSEAGRLWNDLAVARVLADDLPGAERACRHALRLLASCDGASRTTLALYNLAELRVRRGRLTGVEATLERSSAENRRANNRRGLIRDLELWSRLELAQGRLRAALARTAEALDAADDAPVRTAVFELFAARAHGWLEHPDAAAARLERGGDEALEELEPEERPAVWALAHRLDRALELAHGTEWAPLWTALAAGTPPPLEAWRPFDRLEPFRAARLTLDVETLQPGAAPALRVRRAVDALRHAGADGLAERLEARALGPWDVVERFAERPHRDVATLAELLALVGHAEARLVRRHGDREQVLVDGTGGADRVTIPVPRADAVDPLEADPIGTDSSDTDPTDADPTGDSDATTDRLILEADAPGAAPRALVKLFARELTPMDDDPSIEVAAPADDGPADASGTREIARGGLVGRSPAFLAAIDRLERLARGDLPVLVLGESGTGKELAARRVHEVSRRASAPFLAVNCAALSESLVQSDLFGHVRGSFTGAERDRPGVFESARGGTVFLDEIGDLPPPLQGKLLRVLQEGEIRRVGESFARKVDVRIVTATHRGLHGMVDEGTFRQDLYFRLKVANVELPPLRERGDDVMRLAEHFLRRIPGRRLRLDADARERLLAHDWPGNVRELRNVLEVAAALASGDVLGTDHLDLTTPDDPTATSTIETTNQRSRSIEVRDYHRQVEDFRRALLTEALQQTDGNRAEAARRLGMSRQALSYLVRQLDLL